MPVENLLIRNNRGSADTSANFSPNVWRGCPEEHIRSGYLAGTILEANFNSFPITPPTTEGNWGDFAVFTSTGGTIVPDTGTGGGAIFASDGDDEGASVRSVSTPFNIIRTGKPLWFEVRLKTSTITDSKHGFLVGLMENAALSATVPIAAAGTIADQNLVGFHRLEGDGDKVDTIYKANGVTQVTVGADAATLAADTYIKLGMRYMPDNDPNFSSLTAQGTYYLTFYADNLLLADKKQIPSAAGTDFPNDVSLGFVFAVLNATGSTPGSTTIEKLKIIQLG